MPYAVMPAPITLEVRGEGRQNPHIKHSQWVRDREDLERYRVGAGGEVALSRPSSSSSSSSAAAGRELLEGLVTNLFALHKGTLRTPAEDGILPGHMRQMAINAAKSLNIPVDTTTPLKISEISEWDEAFLTGSGRVCVPIDPVECESFDPFKVPTLRMLAAQIDQWDVEHTHTHTGGQGQGEEGKVKDYMKTELKGAVELFERVLIDPMALAMRRRLRVERESEYICVCVCVCLCVLMNGLICWHDTYSHTRTHAHIHNIHRECRHDWGLLRRGSRAGRRGGAVKKRQDVYVCV